MEVWQSDRPSERAMTMTGTRSNRVSFLFYLIDYEEFGCFPLKCWTHFVEMPIFVMFEKTDFIMTITSLDQLDPNGTYTYADYLLWQFTERVELLRGKIREMSAPSRKHQGIVTNLTISLGTVLAKTPCKLYPAPFDVRLIRVNKLKNQDVITVVQPDLSVICDSAKLDTRGCIGAPDLVVEILSPGNSRTEMRDKFELYQEAGVLEYWVVNPTERMIQVWKLNEQGFYIGLPPTVEGDILKTPIIPNLEIIVTDVFLD